MAAEPEPAGPLPQPAPADLVARVAALIERARRIVIIVGAGVSVSCGVPDFRSAGGLYDQVRARFALPDPQLLFDLEYFHADPEPFFAFFRDMMPAAPLVPSRAHRFLAGLAARRKVARVYTQNVDGLETAAGLARAKVVQCHGTLASARCVRCRKRYDSASLASLVRAQPVGALRCVVCSREANLVKPDIVFFGERVSARAGRALQADAPRADLVLIMGSSLRVAPVSGFEAAVPAAVPRVVLNREPIAVLDGRPHLALYGELDSLVAALEAELGWE